MRALTLALVALLTMITPALAVTQAGTTPLFSLTEVDSAAADTSSAVKIDNTVTDADLLAYQELGALILTTQVSLPNLGAAPADTCTACWFTVRIDTTAAAAKRATALSIGDAYNNCWIRTIIFNKAGTAAQDASAAIRRATVD